ncbi:GPALPP motifs-containing protein 1 [Anastrepha obliqua]|uniref:GPALPP motifs-containing protein 1 n=1 Tax=Anastrepha obliqua TaxID=95512 RepID=UPI002409D9F7|nr:GPALPP motifs-containing protein 1 [Anastrepha obliqua]XP_054746946.1 GPALPP motifs-containing protein 1 [Anastrepha obliqua]
MTSDTDSSASSSSSSEKYKKHKKNKKIKCKSEKKKHRHKEKKAKRHKDIKHNRQERHRVKLAITLPMQAEKRAELEHNDDAFGPALPPHLLKDEPKVEKALIGPVLPREFSQLTDSTKVAEPCEMEVLNEDGEEHDMAFSYGPMPTPADGEGMIPMSATQIELEERALELKLAAIESGTGQSVDVKVREEWMLELPAVGLKGGLAALANMKRTFHQGKERPDFSDRSSWTKTPQDAENPTPSTSKDATKVEVLKRNAEAAYERKRDEEQERIAKKHKKDHKRDESLVEMHQKKLRKEQRKKEKELAAAGAKPERRPFSRDVDLKLNKIDKNQTKQIVDKAKILNTKFATGKTKYL